MSIYQNVFELTRQNLTDAGLSMDCQAASFCISTGQQPEKIDLHRAEALQGQDYLNAVWLSLFQKLPPDEVSSSCLGKSNAQMLQRAVDEPAFAIRRIRLINNTYPVKIKLKTQIYRQATIIKNSVFLRTLAKKMPKGIQNKIRGMFA